MPREVNQSLLPSLLQEANQEKIEKRAKNKSRDLKCTKCLRVAPKSRLKQKKLNNS